MKVIDVPGLAEKKKQNMVRIKLVQHWCGVMKATNKYLLALWGISEEEHTGFISGIARIPDEYIAVLKEAGESHASQILRTTKELDLNSLPAYEEFNNMDNMTWADQPEYLKIC